jgi:iron donor protein CyaY
VSAIGMDEREYGTLAERCLARAAEWLERFDPDEVDYATPDGVVKIEFADGVQFVLNRQAGAHQMWYAAGARAWHYDWHADDGTWRDDRDGHELFANVARTVGAKLGRAVELD